MAVGRIVSTYPILNQTIDEPAHFSSGIELLDRGTYLYGPDHPPLARVVAALGPYLAGIRLTPTHHKSLKDRELGVFNERWKLQQFIVGTELFQQGGQYFKNLSLARAGILSFFIICLITTWLWSRLLFGKSVALLAILILSTLPPILGHAGLATTDMALTCFVLSGLFIFTIWLDTPTRFLSALLGVTWGLAGLSKFSALLFLPGCAAALLVWRYAIRKRALESAQQETQELSVRISAVGIAACAAFLTVWAGYGFSLSSPTTVVADARLGEVIDSVVGNEGHLRDLTHAISETPFPLSEFFVGALWQIRHNNLGHPSYFLGTYSTHGWWYYFPVIFLIKTPIPYLVLALLGSVRLLLLSLRTVNWKPFAPVLCAATIMILVIPSNLNLGVRYILTIYPLLAIAAAFGVASMWRIKKQRLLARGTAMGLLAWYLISTIAVHPDYISYFNEIAEPSPEEFVADDWGQDLYRLSLELKQRAISELKLAYFGDARLAKTFNLPPSSRLAPHERYSGWIAISIFELKDVRKTPTHDGYVWLEKYAPVAQIGKSIRLYYIPE